MARKNYELIAGVIRQLHQEGTVSDTNAEVVASTDPNTCEGVIPMREVSFHLPTVLNDGRDASCMVAHCISDIVDAFGGATVTDVQGYWKHNGKLYAEPAKRITVAVDTKSNGLRSRVFAIASEYARKMGQLALYFVNTDGSVEIVDLEPVYE